ncbi:MAG: thioredoxin-disulfide reductase [Alphaproteobacteria bacterium]|nr:thioredoxin-disulfide reductase [Rickettsiales bacterium]
MDTNGTIHNVIVIGSGPAGWTAAIYAARDQLSPIVITGNDIGGQLVTTTIDNFPGFEQPISGSELMDRMRKQAVKYGTKVIEEHVISVDFTSKPFSITTNNNTFLANSVIISTGSYAKWLGLESESKFKGYGVSGCAVCDAFFFKGVKVCVIGGGNTAIEEAIHLSKFATEVYILARGNTLKGEAVMRNKLDTVTNVKIRYNIEVVEILGKEENGQKAVTGVTVKNSKTSEITNIDLSGVFVAIGHSPNSNIFKDHVKLDPHGYIFTELGSVKTNVAGIFAAGDVMDYRYKQAVTAAGTGCMAALEVSEYLLKSKQ